MMISVFLMASNCRYHGTSVPCSGLSSFADWSVFSGSFDAITSSEHVAGVKRLGAIVSTILRIFLVEDSIDVALQRWTSTSSSRPSSHHVYRPLSGPGLRALFATAFRSVTGFYQRRASDKLGCRERSATETLVSVIAH